MTMEHTFCRECSSSFCPHVAAWMYEGNDAAKDAWNGEPERQPEPDEAEPQQELFW